MVLEKNPYTDLYVYGFKGVLAAKDEALLGHTFLGNWVEEEYFFLFFLEPAPETVAWLVKTASHVELIEEYHFTYEQWQGGVLKPMRIEPFLIAPPWEEAEPEAGELGIILDPGVVFGNGLHPTTRDCLRALVRAGSKRPFRSVMDLGTGTGILALAASQLGAERVIAVDLNPLCVKTARRNLALNHLEGAVVALKGDAEAYVDRAADLVIANIHYDVICNLLNRRPAPEWDRLILSGLMRSQARKTVESLERCGYHIEKEWDHDRTWFTFLTEKDAETR